MQFAQARAGQVTCAVYDAGGRRVATLFDGVLGAGRHEFDWNAADLAPGVYIVRLEGAAAGSARAVRTAR